MKTPLELLIENMGFRKLSTSAPKYRQAEIESISCATCSAFVPKTDTGGSCTKYSFNCSKTAVCDGWSPRIEA